MEGTQAKDRLYRAACDLFVEKGFRDTTVRDIANRAGVNSGLMHYYYKSKRNIALDIVEKMAFEAQKIIERDVDRMASPALFLGLIMRLTLYFLYSDVNARFYTDCLKEDILEEAAIPKCMEILGLMNRQFGTGLKRQDLMLIQSIAIGAQRTMILKKQEGIVDYPLEVMGELEYRILLSFFSLERSTIGHLTENCSRMAQAMYAGNTRFTDIRNLI